MIFDEEDYLAHYGTPRHSGRYPWGSGGEPHQRAATFLSTVKELRDKGLDDETIAKSFDMTKTDLRNYTSISRELTRQEDIQKAQKLRAKGWGMSAIGREMGRNESSIRALLKSAETRKISVLQNTATVLRDAVADKGFIDIGTGTERHMNISWEKLRAAVKLLTDEGYTVHYDKVPQLGTGKRTTLKVLAGPGVTYSDYYKNRDKLALVTQYSDDGGGSYIDFQTPISIDSKRISVRYGDEGGKDADGVIYVRPGVKDIELGGSRYAQVRVAVDGTHYLKGMAIYKDDLPKGVDLMFNTNKSDTGNKLDAMKPIKDDPENPFGATVRQIHDIVDGKKVVSSAMNLVNEEGKWDDWSRSLSSQMLSKQSPVLAKRQLDLTFDRKKSEFEEIMRTDNPSVRRRLLRSFSDDMDSSAVHLKAAAMPRQSSRVILPVNAMRPTEIYAPGYTNGERVVLIRYPHGGKFEIPELIVNNRNPEAKKLLGDAKDAIGIHSSVAERLSGADFDGDTVLVIPNKHRDVKTENPLEGLKGFDPQAAYPSYEGMKKMTATEKGFEMGDVSNLITDMHLRGANNAELARAVRHSMVVIDAEKHGLDWKRSAVDNGIAALKKKYQGDEKTGNQKPGARTLISRASSRLDVPERKPRSAKDGGPIDKETGKLVYTPTGNQYTRTTVSEKTGKVTEKLVDKMERSTKLAETDDAHTLSSGTPMETIYADHSNRMKAVANEARLVMDSTKSIPYSREAKARYSREVERLNAALNLALLNAPRERQAQVIANAQYRLKRQANPDMDEAEKKKIQSQELKKARGRVGAKKKQIEISDKEWEAIQAGAISGTKLDKILENTDLDKIKQLATPKVVIKMTATKKNKAIALLRAGYDRAEVAEALGVSVSTLNLSISED